MSDKRRNITWLALAMAGVLVVVSLADADGFRRYGKLAAEVRSLEARTEDLRIRNAALSREVAALRDDPRAMERAAREELGFVRPGEIVLNLE